MSEKLVVGDMYQLDIGTEEEKVDAILVEHKNNVLVFDHAIYNITVNLKSNVVDMVSKESNITAQDNNLYMLNLSETLLDHLDKYSEGTKTLQNNLKKYIKKVKKTTKEE